MLQQINDMRFPIADGNRGHILLAICKIFFCVAIFVESGKYI